MPNKARPQDYLMAAVVLAVWVACIYASAM